MRVVFVPREGVDLYSALLSSETSREALRFYQPARTPAGVEVTTASIGSALSLVSDLRWYVRRYMHDVIFEIAPGTFCTADIARMIYYGREPVLQKRWKYRRIYSFREGRLVSDEPLHARADSGEKTPENSGEGEMRIEVWCTRDQYLAKKGGDREDFSVTSS